MSLLKNLSLMSFSTAVRLGAAVLTVSMTARALGPENFGVLMLWMSVATLAGMPCNFGLSAYLLREIGRAPETAGAILGDTLSAKLILTTVVACASLAALPFLPAPARAVFVLLLVTMLSEGFSEFLNAGFRASSRFDLEARLAFAAAPIYSLSVGLTAWLTHSVPAIALAYMVSRLFVTALTWTQLRNVIGGVRPAAIAQGWRRLRAALSYALDYGLSAIFGQIDSLVLNHYLNAAAVGLHQAGMRLFMAGAAATPVLANVFLPRAAAAHALGSGASAAEDGRVQLAFLSMGAFVGIALAVAGKWVVPLLLGRGFDALVPLLPWFGLLLAFRFAVGAWGILLTARGLQRYRASANLVHWIAIGAAASVLVPRLGNLGWLLALIVGHVVLFIAYVGRIARRTRRDARTLGLTALVLLAFVPVLKWP